MKVAIKPMIIRWACHRAGLDSSALLKSFPKLQTWEQGTNQPTLKQLEAFAHKTHVPLGIFFLSEPPQERLPIPDFRTMETTQLRQPSPDLLETIYLCQQRQAWYKDYMQKQGLDTVNYTGSVTLGTDAIKVAENIRQVINFGLEQRSKISTWKETLRFFKNQVEDQGVLVMANGVVGSNTHRKLDPQEFRGFALADKFAPLIFINASDSKSAQIFTIAHELAHIWLGASGISDTQAGKIPDEKTEYWCNQVAAELLVPMADLKKNYQAETPLTGILEQLARRYKVSTLVILRRIHDLGAISREILWKEYKKELSRIKKLALRSTEGGGGLLSNIKY